MGYNGSVPLNVPRTCVGPLCFFICFRLKKVLKPLRRRFKMLLLPRIKPKVIVGSYKYFHIYYVPILFLVYLYCIDL